MKAFLFFFKEIIDNCLITIASKLFPMGFCTRHMFYVIQKQKKVTMKPAKKKRTFQKAIKHILTSELSEVVSFSVLDSSYRTAYRRFSVWEAIRSECLFYVAVLFRKWRSLCARSPLCRRSVGSLCCLSLLLGWFCLLVCLLFLFWFLKNIIELCTSNGGFSRRIK